MRTAGSVLFVMKFFSLLPCQSVDLLKSLVFHEKRRMSQNHSFERTILVKGILSL